MPLTYCVDSCEALRASLDAFPDQHDGNASAFCETGEPYVEFNLAALARPGDEKVVDGFVAEAMAREIERYFDGRKGRIYWRVRLEWETQLYHRILRYDELGMDMDPIMNKKCVMDKNWLAVKAYCRVFRAVKKDEKAA